MATQKELYGTPYTNPQTGTAYQFNVRNIYLHINLKDSSNTEDQYKFKFVSNYIENLRSNKPEKCVVLYEELVHFKQELLKISMKEKLDTLASFSNLTSKDISQANQAAQSVGLSYNELPDKLTKTKSKQSCKCIIS